MDDRARRWRVRQKVLVIHFGRSSIGAPASGRAMASLDHVRKPVTDLQIIAKIRIDGSPDWVGISETAVWISNRQANSVARIDPMSNTVAATVAVGTSPCAGL